MSRARPTARDHAARDAHLMVLVTAQRFTADLERVCQTEGISHPQWVTLWVLCLADDVDAGVPIGAIADGLLTRASDTTRLVDRLAAAGLVERHPSPTDRRQVLVRATAAGIDLFGRLGPKVRDYHREQWRRLTLEDLQVLQALLARAGLDIDPN